MIAVKTARKSRLLQFGVSDTNVCQFYFNYSFVNF